MNYHQIIIHVPDESREALTGRLSDMGVLGIIENGGSITAYFNGQRDIGKISAELLEFKNVLRSSGLDPDITFESSDVPDRDWGEEWKKHFIPLDAGSGLVIVPSWLEHRTARKKIVIDPGMAFGTGQHETTLMCLELIEKYAGCYKNGSFLDAGTGTGVLAIAAAKLGLSDVTAVDTDPVAVDAALGNAELNGADIDVKQGDIYSVNGKYDLVAANLFSGILIEIAVGISERLDAGGKAILSGILHDQVPGVEGAMEKAGLTLKEKIVNGKWTALVFGR